MTVSTGSASCQRNDGGTNYDDCGRDIETPSHLFEPMRREQ